MHWHQSRVLQRFRTGPAEADLERQETVLERLSGFLPHLPPRLDRLLGRVDR